MRRIALLVVSLAVSLFVFAVPSSATHISGCTDRPTVWNGGSNVDCASDPDGSNDDWNGGYGHDVLFGEAGFDNIRGSNGNDNIEAGQGGDFVYGGPGDDLIRENQSSSWDDYDDVMSGEEGNDVMRCGGGADWCRGGNDSGDTVIHCHDEEPDDIGGFPGGHTHITGGTGC